MTLIAMKVIYLVSTHTHKNEKCITYIFIEKLQNTSDLNTEQQWPS